MRRKRMSSGSLRIFPQGRDGQSENQAQCPTSPSRAAESQLDTGLEPESAVHGPKLTSAPSGKPNK